MRFPLPLLPRRAFPLLGPVALLGVLPGAPASLHAQSPQVFHACYVPLTGSVYRIKTADTKPACSSTSHVEFSWTDGVDALRTGDAAGGDLTGTYPNPSVAGLQGRAVSSTAPSSGQVLTFDGTAWTPAAPPSSGGGVSDHGALGGLTDDDHPQYLLTDGVRNATSGFAVTGTLRTGSVPVSGAGVRLMWLPGQAAFRAGQVLGPQWDDANIGLQSVAMGRNTTASGELSTALGSFTTASGAASTAMGSFTTASGTGSTAMGSNTTASGASSTAMGGLTTASGALSTAMGRLASTNGHAGSFVYGDASTFSTVTATAPNQFVVRAQHIWLGTTSSVSNPAGHFLTTSTGAHLTTGGAWTNSSDVALKEGFQRVDAEEVLRKVAGLPVQEWSYRAEGASVRHLGPTAQDFHAAFGLGGSDEAIATVDADGVSLLAVQALEKRTSEQAREIDELRAENAELRGRLAELAELRARLDRLERERRDR